jgi:hypothetical protein
MFARRVILVAMAARKETLKRISGNAGVAELTGRAGSWSKTLNRISARFCSLTDTFQSRSFSRTCPPL